MNRRATLLGLCCAPLLAACRAVKVQAQNVARKIPIILDAWGGVDKSTEQVTIVDDTGRGGLRVHAIARDGMEYNSAASFSARIEGAGAAVGTFHYGEIPKGSRGYAWGSNVMAGVYEPDPASGIHALEVNAGNWSGSEAPFASGVFSVAYGNAATRAHFIGEAAVAAPAGRPWYGLWLRENEKGGGASKTGVFIERVESGEAVNVTGQRIALSRDGETYLQYDETAGVVRLVKNGQVVAVW